MAKLQFVSSLFASKVFLAQVVAIMATVAGAAGVKFLDDPLAQQQAVTVLFAVGTILLRWLAATGPVSIGGSLSPPPSRDVPVGTSIVTVAPADEQDATAANAVVPLSTGPHVVTVLPPAAPGYSVPSDVLLG